jgi:hypothetical protein
MVFTVSKVVLLIGVVLILISAFGVSFGTVNVFELGVGISFASMLVP